MKQVLPKWRVFAGVVGCALGLGVALSDALGDDPSLQAHRTYGTWHSSVIGSGGFLQHAIWAPSDARRMYLSSDVGGCWRSSDGGNTWRMLHGALPPANGENYSIRGIVADPRNADRVYIAADTGVWRSEDAGNTWKQLLKAHFAGNGWYRGDGRVLVLDAKHPENLYAGSIKDGVYVSNDAGATWTCTGPEGVFPRDIYIDVRNSRRIWLSCGGQDGAWVGGKQTNLSGGLFVSEDGGRSWTKVADDGMREMIQDPNDPSVLIALSGSGRVVRSRDDGRTWTKFDEGLAPPKDDARTDGSYGAMAAGPDYILIGGNGGNFYRLDKAAASWKKISVRDVEEGDWWGSMKRPGYRHFGSALSWVGISPHNPSTWVFTDWYACYLSPDRGASWKLAIDGVEMTVVHDVEQAPANPRVVHVGVADVGYFRSNDGGSTFEQVDKGISDNIKHIAVSPLQPGRLYAVGPQRWEWWANQVFISDDDGTSWRRSAMKGLPEMEKRRCNTVVVHPSSADLAYLVLNGEVGKDSGGVWKSTDAGQSWTWMGQGLPARQSLFRSDIWVAGPEIAVSSNGSLLAGSDDQGRLFRYTPKLGHWEEVKLAGGGGVNAVVADAKVAGRFYLCRKEGGLWRSDDSGASWECISQANAWSVAVDTNDARRVAFNGSDGAFVSEDSGVKWRKLDESLPYRHFRNVITFAGDRVIVGTGGNGVFWTK